MKICPKCSQTYGDESLNFCLNDGVSLQQMSGAAPTVENIDPSSSPNRARPTEVGGQAIPGFSAAKPPIRRRSWPWVVGILGGIVLLCGGGVAGLIVFVSNYKPPAPNRRTAPTPAISPSKASTPFTVDLDTDDPDAITTSKGDYDVTMAKYNQISIGTSRSDVERLLGGKGTEISSSEGGGMRFSVNKWEGKNYKSIILTFKNDKVMSRSQVSLK